MATLAEPLPLTHPLPIVGLLCAVALLLLLLLLLARRHVLQHARHEVAHLLVAADDAGHHVNAGGRGRIGSSAG